MPFSNNTKFNEEYLTFLVIIPLLSIVYKIGNLL